MANVTLKEQAYSKLRGLVLSGELKAGEFLTERFLVELLGMSRTPIRSALERLDADGLANYTPNKGLIVAEISLDRVIDFYDFRIAMECHLVRKLALREWSSKDIQWFENNLDLQKKYVADHNYVEFTKADSQYHLQLANIYGNAEIVKYLEQLQDRLTRIAITVLQKDRTRIKVSYEDHMRIFQHIIQGKEEDAPKDMEHHLEFGKRILIL
jgi:DNA-binding GntR family transcriptional regulator